MRSRYSLYVRTINFLSDIFLVNIAYLLAFDLIHNYLSLRWDNGYFHTLIIFNIIWLLASSVIQLFWSASDGLEEIYRYTWRSVLIHAIIFMGYLFFSKSTISHRFYLLCIGLMSVFFLLSRFVLTYFSEFLLNRLKPGKQIAIIGYNPTAKKLADYFRKQKADYVFHGFFDDELSRNGSTNFQQRTAVVGSIENCILYAKENKVEEIYSTILPNQNSKVQQLVQTADQLCIRVKFVPDFSRQMNDRFYMTHVGDFPIITLRQEPLDEITSRVKKRLLDILLSSFVIIFILSWLTPLLAICIKISTKGPVFFAQRRSGRGNRPFTCLKFRSMKINSLSDQLQATKDDDRITSVGRFIRKRNIDEFPQFLNVLKGDMSIVGPRPHMLKHTEHYSVIVDKFMVRHLLKPGITGWAQANGFRGETETSELMQKRVEYDLWYLENWSLMLDVKIVIITIIQMIKGHSRAR